ncbi:hypothetical protein RKE25_02610 [Dyella sp. BiH032]|uniref:hypothetical protein n=1 Tax=Dyella sp. BiH032 TaxID=3075430 RepID=UPI00289381ED|nr:hypothetical protein [Dyella sp. BiH032]WNL46548.1 hypothetical protein RKE25_02610 [Dyella sp. BiH032]
MTAALKLLVTPAGRAALVNAKRNGTLPIVLDTVGVTAAVFAPTGNEAQLPGEIKRIATIAGGAAAADTIHVTIRDSGSDTYSVRGVGFYLQDGTLFALYGQAAVVVEKSAQATMLLAMDVQFADIDATSITFGDTDFQLNPATTELLGVVELATDDETTAGNDAQRAVTPKGLLAALNARLGLGAPSTFVKGLLTAANAAVFRTALAIKSAALKDEGAGNGLDADLLDGQHGSFYRAWSNLTGVPTDFTPSPHQHSAADITSGTLVVARGGTGIASLPAGYFLMGAGANPMVPRAPADVLADIGAAAKQHSHPISDINGLQAALDAKTTPAAVAAQISAAVNGLINGAPGALDTLKELADAMGDDPNFATTVTNALAQKLNLSGGKLTGSLSATSVMVGPNATSGYPLDVDVGSGAGRVLFRYTNGINIDGVNPANSAYVGLQTTSPWTFGQGFTVLAGKATFNTDDTTFTSVAPLRFTGMGAGGTMFIHGLNGSGDDICNISRGNANSYYTLNWNGDIRSISSSTSAVYVSNGGNLRIGSTSGVSKYLRTNPSNGDLEIVNNAYNAVVARITDGGAVIANGGFQYSDRRLKTDIKPRAVKRGLALTLARMFSEWTRVADGARDVGVVAQRLARHAPHHVLRGPHRGRLSGLLAVDKAGVALEASMDNALHLTEHEKRIAALERLINKREKSQ